MSKVIPFANIFIGLLVFSLQISALAIWTFDPDLPSVGIWGGIFLVAFGALLMLKKLNSKMIKIMAIFGVLIGATLIGLYSWSIDTYQEFIANCDLVPWAKICDRAAVDSLMIISGILAIFVNAAVFVKTSAFSSD